MAWTKDIRPVSIINNSNTPAGNYVTPQSLIADPLLDTGNEVRPNAVIQEGEDVGLDQV